MDKETCEHLDHGVDDNVTQRRQSVVSMSRNVTGEYETTRATSDNVGLTFYRIQNPLTGIPKDELLQNVERFARGHDLNDALPYLSKGALVAQSPDQFDTIGELDDDDRETLRIEKQHRWRHPKALYLTILLNSISAAIQGTEINIQSPFKILIDI